MSLHDRAEITSQVAAPPAAGRKLGLALLVIATAQLMLVLDDTIVNIALPSMQRSLHIATPHLNWVASFYALAFGGLLLAGGRAGDLFGRLRVFRTGIIVFALASMAGGFAPDGTALVAARIVQGCGAALAAPGALALLATTFPAGPARTRALGVYGAMAGLGSVVGLLLGGTLTEYLSWRWVLFINVPIAAGVLIGTGVLVPGDSEHGRLDIPGAVTATLGIGSLIYALTRGNTNGWADAGTLACFAAGAVLLAAFLLIERASRAPMLPSRVVRDRNRAGANVVLLLLGTGMLAMFYLLTLYMQLVRGYSPVHTGLAYLPVVASFLAAGGVVPRLLGALPARAVIAAGMTLSARRARVVRGRADPHLELLGGHGPGHAGLRNRRRADLHQLHGRRHASRRTTRQRSRGRPAQHQRADRQRARRGRTGRHRLDRNQNPPARPHHHDRADRRLRRRPPRRRHHLRSRCCRRTGQHQRAAQQRGGGGPLSPGRGAGRHDAGRQAPRAPAGPERVRVGHPAPPAQAAGPSPLPVAEGHAPRHRHTRRPAAAGPDRMDAGPPPR